MHAKEESPVSRDRNWQRLMKLILLLVSILLSAAGFLALDWFRSAAVRHTWRKGPHFSCGTLDPVRIYAFKPNCASMMYWGPQPFDFFTNSLGLRDEKVRPVPLAEERPRLLMLGNSFTQSEGTWQDSYVGKIAAHFPQYDILNGGVMGYSPSTYLTTTRMLLAKGVKIDEVVVFIGVSDVAGEASTYQDADASGAIIAVKKPTAKESGIWAWYKRHYVSLANHFMLTHTIVESIERFLVRHGYYSVAATRPDLPVFDADPCAWTYRAIDPVAWAPLGLEGGIAKAKAKMNQLWAELNQQGIPLTIVVYPYSPQLIHDTVESKQVGLWREWCEGKCKRFITAFPEFFAVKEACPQLQPGCWYPKLFVFGDMHYNAAGNALVADAVTKSLTADPPGKLHPLVAQVGPRH